MALVIRDAAVSALAFELQKALNLPSKAEAVRVALHNELARVLRRERSLHERIAHSQAMAQAIGACDPDFDMKKFTDEMWDGL